MDRVKGEPDEVLEFRKIRFLVVPVGFQGLRARNGIGSLPFDHLVVQPTASREKGIAAADRQILPAAQATAWHQRLLSVGRFESLGK